MPETIDELWAIWKKKPGALLLAGGTDLLVRLKSSVQTPPILICLEKIAAITRIYEKDDSIFIGAAATLSSVESNPLIQKNAPVLTKAIRALGSPPIRHMGTLGGNICTASPAGDTLPPLYVLHAELEIRSGSGARRVPIKDFIIAPGTITLAEGEMLYGVWLRSDRGYPIHHFEKVGQRKAPAISIASLAALLNVTGGGVIEEARLAWGSVGPTVVTSSEAESALMGKSLSKETVRSVIPLVERVVSPIDDLRASAAYRRKVAGNLLYRLVEFESNSPLADENPDASRVNVKR